MLLRNLLLLPLIVVYMLILLVAALPDAIRPSVIDAPSTAAKHILASVGVRAGMLVFGGEVEKKRFAKKSQCLVVTGTDWNGEETRIHPIEPCPIQGFRWKPEIYRHMLFHWTWFIGPRHKPGNLWAMADHFCNSSPDRRFQHVTLNMVYGWVSYETGIETSSTWPMGRVKCRS